MLAIQAGTTSLIKKIQHDWLTFVFDTNNPRSTSCLTFKGRNAIPFQTIKSAISLYQMSNSLKGPKKGWRCLMKISEIDGPWKLYAQVSAGSYANAVKGSRTIWMTMFWITSHHIRTCRANLAASSVTSWSNGCGQLHFNNCLVVTLDDISIEDYHFWGALGYH